MYWLTPATTVLAVTLIRNSPSVICCNVNPFGVTQARIPDTFNDLRFMNYVVGGADPPVTTAICAVVGMPTKVYSNDTLAISLTSELIFALEK